MARRKKHGLYPGEQFVMYRLEMLESRAWRELGDPTRRLLERLAVEHMRHGGSENGDLICTYDDFEVYGIRRGSIAAAIREAVAFGFLEVREAGYRSAGLVQPANLYRLTYVEGARRRTAPADKARCRPTDEWRRIKTDADVAYARARIAGQQRKAKQAAAATRAKRKPRKAA